MGLRVSFLHFELRKFRHGQSLAYRCSQQNSSTVELVDYAYDGRARRGLAQKFIIRWQWRSQECELGASPPLPPPSPPLPP